MGIFTAPRLKAGRYTISDSRLFHQFITPNERDRWKRALRHRILKNLGLGRQSQGGKVLDAFIKEPKKFNLR